MSQQLPKEVQQIVDNAVSGALKASGRVPVNEIQAICDRAGVSDRAQGFIDSGATMEQVTSALFDQLAGPDPSNPTAVFAHEYEQQQTDFEGIGVSKDDYIASRKITEGIA